MKLVSGYQSVGMPCIVVSVKFDGGLSISFLRNEQRFTKKLGFKTDQFLKKFQFSKTFQTPPF
jgi:hypothetical protein